jgi:hypothetical protein
LNYPGKEFIMAETIERALAIIRATKDGDALAPRDLKIVELAVNGFLNEEGEKLFQKLYEDVAAGTYRWPWYKEIEHLTLDHEGYVRRKGREVEHFELAYAYGARSTEYAKEIARRCAFLEEHGVEPTTHAIVHWEKALASIPNADYQGNPDFSL